MKLALRAEWTKLRTVAGPRWLLLGSIVLTVAVSAAVMSATSATSVAPATGCHAGGCGADRTKLSLTGVYVGQVPVAVLAVLVMSSEYSSGLIRVTLAAVPRRLVVLAAKAVTVAGTVAAAGAVSVLGSLSSSWMLSRPPSAGRFEVGSALGSILYLSLIALLSLGVATMIRDSAAGVGIVLGLLYLFPVLSLSIADPRWQRLLQQIEPMRGLPVDSWAGLGVTAAWAGAALVAGGVLLCSRDG